MKHNAGGLWFSAKRKQTAKSMLVQEIGDTLKQKHHIIKRLRASALRGDANSTEVLKSLIDKDSKNNKEV
jgi:hypothetical protein